VGESARKDFDAATIFVENTVQSLNDDTLSQFVTQAPGLAQYQFLLKAWRRNRSHTAPEAVESVLARLSSRLDPFESEFYNLMLQRSLDATLDVGDRVLNVTVPRDYAKILRLGNRKLREHGFHKRLAVYKTQGDLFAFGLYKKIRTANALAEVRDFPNALDASLFNDYLTPEMVDAVLKAFRDHAPLTIRFQKADLAYQRKLLGLSVAQPWDLEARPTGTPEPRFVIGGASQAVIEATKIFGGDYRAELGHLLDPRNGRLDIRVNLD
jgi:oligoendopeptidase F